MSEKLQKVLARAGLGSRRAMEEVIAAGKVSVNGSIIGLGVRVVASDKIRVNHRIIKFPPAFSEQVHAPTRGRDRDGENTNSTVRPSSSPRGRTRGKGTLSRNSKPGTRKIQSARTRILIYSKPDGEICTRKDPEGRKTVYTHLPPLFTGRWIAVGRLDINSLGLMLFTNNGELANQLMHPRYQIEREYAVRVLGNVDAAMLQSMKDGVQLSDGMARFKSIVSAGGTGANHWYHVVICEGRQREVRRIWEFQGVKISRLIRIRYANVTLPPRLKQGRCQELTRDEVAEVFGQFALPTS